MDATKLARVQWVPTLEAAARAPFFGALHGTSTVLPLPKPARPTSASGGGGGGGSDIAVDGDGWRDGFRYMLRLPGLGWRSLHRLAVKYRWRLHWVTDAGANSGMTPAGASGWKNARGGATAAAAAAAVAAAAWIPPRYYTYPYPHIHIHILACAATALAAPTARLACGGEPPRRDDLSAFALP